MKIADDRDALKGCTKDQLSALITDMYKAIPKTVITAKEIDDLITSAKNPKPKTKSLPTSQDNGRIARISIETRHSIKGNNE